MAEGKLEGRVAIVTGGAGGIGQVLVRGLVGEGARVAILDIDEQGLDRFADELRSAGHAPRCFVRITDISDPMACEEAVSRVLEHFGDVHILINNGGLGMGAIRADHMTDLVKIHEITPEMWQRFTATNFSGAFYMTRATVPHLLAQGWGRIINVTTSFFTMLRGSFHPYGPCKAGLEAMSCGHAREFAGTGVTVNVVVPGGPADTPMITEESGFDRADLIPPQAMVPPVLWLCSNAGDTITGNRYVGADWDASLPAEQAVAKAAAPIGWPELAESPVWPGGKPEE